LSVWTGWKTRFSQKYVNNIEKYNEEYDKNMSFGAISGSREPQTCDKNMKII